MKKVLFFLITSTGMIACKQKDPDWILPPNKFYYQITQNSMPLSTVVLDSLKFYYINENGIKIYNSENVEGDGEHVLLPSKIGSDYLDAEGVRACLELNIFGVQHNTWYFEYPDGSIDTLYVESQQIPKSEGRKDPCYCIAPFTVVRLNGRDAYIHPTLKPVDNKPIWVLERQ